MDSFLTVPRRERMRKKRYYVLNKRRTKTRRIDPIISPSRMPNSNECCIVVKISETKPLRVPFNILMSTQYKGVFVAC